MNTHIRQPAALASILLLIVVGSLLYWIVPSLGRSTLDQKINLSFVRLRSLQQAVAIYQESAGAVPESGSPSEMHLPPAEAVWNGVLGVPADTLNCPCYRPTQASMDWGSENFNYWPDDLHPHLLQTSPLFTTLNCNRDMRTVGAPFITHRGVGVRINGQLINLTKFGNVIDPKWWEPSKETQHQ